MKKGLKISFMAIFVVVVAVAAWFVIGGKKSEASNYYGCFTYIRFDNSELRWDEVYAYAWDRKNNVQVIKLDKKEDNTFGFNINGDDYCNILFKNTPGEDNWDKQTKDLKTASGPDDYVFTPVVEADGIGGTFTRGSGKTVTIYYANADFENPYVYYQIGDGKWTEGFGSQMKESESRKGYYEVEILVPENTDITCCFNAGNDSVKWDNNNTQNYKVEASKTKYRAQYIIENGTITAIK